MQAASIDFPPMYRYAWVLGSPVPAATPHVCPGRLSLWELPENLDGLVPQDVSRQHKVASTPHVALRLLSVCLLHL